MSRNSLRRAAALAMALLASLALTPEAAARKPGDPTTPRKINGPIPWIEYRTPVDSTIDFGAYGGLLLLSDHHELFSPDPELVAQGQAPVRKLSPDVGLRVGYYPSRWIGVEAEGGVMPTRLRDRDDFALLYTARGQLVGRLALAAIVPFVVAGGGVLGIHSKPGALGRDADAALHFGGGVEVFLVQRVALRLDARDVVSWRRGTEPSFGAHSFELTLGVTISLQVPR